MFPAQPALNLDDSHVVFVMAGSVKNEIRIGLLVCEISMTALIWLTCKCERRVTQGNAKLVIKLVAIDALPLDGTVFVSNRQQEILVTYLP